MALYREDTTSSLGSHDRNGFGYDDEGEQRMRSKPRPARPVMNRHVGEDPARMICEIVPGKKGGDFPLPFGGQMTVPSGPMGKKDVVTCCMVSPSDRYKYQPPIKTHEHLQSEIFLLAMSCKSIKKGPPLTLSLPYYREKTGLYSNTMLFKRAEDDDWSVIDCVFNDESCLAECSVECGGILAVKSVTRLERFEVPVQGCLYNAKLHHQISVRFPKKTCDSEIACDLSVIPLNRNIVDKLRGEYPADMGDVVALSDMYEIRPVVSKVFRRSVTVKLPLPPQMPSDKFPVEDLAVMQLTATDGWQLYDVPVKVIKNTVAFETRNLTRYCVVLAKPDRKKRVKEAFRHIERENAMVRGDIMPFIHIQERLWTLWFDVVSWARSGPILDRRLDQGFRKIKQMQLPMFDQAERQEEAERAAMRRPYRSAKSRQLQPEPEKKPDREDLDLVNEAHFEIEVGGDVRICEDDANRNNLDLRFHDRLPENYRRYFIEPIPIAEGRILTGFLKCYERASDGSRNCVRTFDFDITPEAVTAFMTPEPEPEPEPEEPEVVESEPTVKPVTPLPEPPPPPPPSQPKQPPPPKQNPVSFARLTKPTKPAKKLIRDPKVLTGRSLMSLAREVEQGLTLAIHLDISDSTITGMGFDALANGLSLVDITYRILLLWKRRTSRYREKQVDLLISAMRDMGRNDLAEVISNQHLVNAEITPECFDSSNN